jgi:hypothetical protein
MNGDTQMTADEVFETITAGVHHAAAAAAGLIPDRVNERYLIVLPTTTERVLASIAELTRLQIDDVAVFLTELAAGADDTTREGIIEVAAAVLDDDGDYADVAVRLDSEIVTALEDSAAQHDSDPGAIMSALAFFAIKRLQQKHTARFLAGL